MCTLAFVSEPNECFKLFIISNNVSDGYPHIPLNVNLTLVETGTFNVGMLKHRSSGDKS